VRIIAGRWRGRELKAPSGGTTRPTADRVRQALFDMLLHAPWGGRWVVEGANVLDAFAGTGALGLEALSRGAAHGWFIEQDKAALAALKANIAMLRAEATLVPGDAMRPPRGKPCSLVFLDPPYGREDGPKAIAALTATGWIATGALIILEVGRNEDLPELGELLAERTHGTARVTIWRAPQTAAPSP